MHKCLATSMFNNLYCLLLLKGTIQVNMIALPEEHITITKCTKKEASETCILTINKLGLCEPSILKRKGLQSD